MEDVCTALLEKGFSYTGKEFVTSGITGWDKTVQLLFPRGGGNIGLIFAGYVPLASQSPYPIIVYSVANYRPNLFTFGQICNFHNPNLVTFYFYELNHFLDWMKNTLLFITV